MQTMKDVLVQKKREKSQPLRTVSAKDTVLDAVMLMNEYRVGALVVTNARLESPEGPVSKDEVVGIVSERDILSRIVAARKPADQTLVAQIMTHPVTTVDARTLVDEAKAIMTEKRRRHLPVCTDTDVVGIVSIGDLARWDLSDREYRIHELVGYITAG